MILRMRNSSSPLRMALNRSWTLTSYLDVTR
jgi:hypothetical protein